MNCPAISPSNSPPTPPSPAPTFGPNAPAILVVEGWKGIRDLYPIVAVDVLPGIEMLLADSLDEARRLLQSDGHRICGFVTNGLVRGAGKPQATLELVDEMLGERRAPFVVFTGLAILPTPQEFRRPPLAILGKVGLASMNDSLLPFKAYVHQET